MDISLPPPVRRCWAQIDLSALESNIRRIRQALPKRLRYLAVVKADAYGHGLHPMAARLMHAGVDQFAVANVAEAIALRELSPEWSILILSALLPEEDESLFVHHLTPTISSREEIERLECAAQRHGAILEVHAKIDTGMGRLGVWHEECDSFWASLYRARHLRLAGVYTHFSCADSDRAFTDLQRFRFLAALKRANPGLSAGLLIHADNSAGVESFSPESPFNAVRIGLLQFGVAPYPRSLLEGVEVDPVLSFHARVSLVKSVPAGTGISYGRSHVLSRNARLAILSAGYGDGISRQLSNRGKVLIRGKRCPILGRVTMDQTIVDVTDAPGVMVGDEATLIGRQGDGLITLAEYSRDAETIPWEALTSLSARVRRTYVNAMVG